MRSDSGKTDSIWMQTADIPPKMPLSGDTGADVCIVGAGIAGLSCAYLLCQEGVSVVVLDDGPIGGGETGRTTAHLSNALDDGYCRIEHLHGERGARLAAESHTAAIRMIERIVAAEKIDCDFSRLDGFLFPLAPGGDAEELKREFEASRRAGLNDVRMLDGLPFRGPDTGPCLVFPNQAQFHPLRYLSGLVSAIERRSGRIYTKSHAASIEGGLNPTVTVDGGFKVKARAIVVATNSPVNDWVTIHTKQASYRSYVIGALAPRGAIHAALYWDTGNPYHYARLQPLTERYDVLIAGGEDHKTGQADDTDLRFQRLEKWARHLFPEIEDLEYQWSGQVLEPVDAMAFIGRNPGDENIYIATGDSGHGMTHGTIAGMLITDLIQGRTNEWAHLYDPSRKTLKAAGEFTRENWNTARQYVDLLTPGDVESEVQIPAGEGAVMRRGLKKVAIYCDDTGALYEMSAVCPHLGCVVDWNKTEKSWDCPCHGSRFSAMGKVINGPANRDLEPMSSDERELTAPTGPLTP